MSIATRPVKKWQSRLIAFSVSAILISIGLSIILKVFNDNIVFFYSPSELKLKHHKVKESFFRVGGLVKDGSVVSGSNSNSLEFIITDLESELLIVYHGSIPSLFKEGQGVVAYGKLNHDGKFLAQEILAKHDENYMPREVQNSLKKTGQWRGTQNQ